MKDSAISINDMVQEFNSESDDKLRDDGSISSEVLATLAGKTREELIDLLKLCGKRVEYALLSKEEKRERMKLKVYALAQDSESEPVILKAANDWLDREDGRPGQSVQIDQRVSGDVQHHVELSVEALRERMTQIIGKGKIIENAG